MNPAKSTPIPTPREIYIGSSPEVVMRNQTALIETHERREALLRWLAALGPLARPARSIVDVVLTQPSLPKPVREAAKSARKALGDDAGTA
jgi:hypothetical protein